jgi:hypothetical protein
MATLKTPIDAVAQAATEMERAAIIAETAQRKRLRMEIALDSNRRVGGDGPGFTEDETLAAVEGIAEARVQDARATRAAKEARANYDAAVAAERADRRVAVHAEMRPIAKKLDAALKVCIELNETARRLDAALHECRSLDERQADAMSGGAAFARLALRELNRERYDLWCAAMVAEGVLDEK